MREDRRMDFLERLDKASAATKGVAKGVKADQLAQPTPCAEWDVQALMNHMIGSFEYFTKRAAGEDPGPQSLAATTTGLAEAVQRLDGGIDALVAGWRRPGALEQTMKSSFGEMPAQFLANISLGELVGHGWDLARATGQRLDLDPVLADELLAEMRNNLRPEARQTAFGPERQAPAGAPALDQLAAFLGRAV
jgi:uncharacterized protein (TIGR03086 family)